MSFNFQIKLLIGLLLFCGLSYADGPMKKIVEKDGFGIYFLFYREGNGIEDNGVVIYLKNDNNYKLKYTFQLVFRADEFEKEQQVTGVLKAFERRTGSNDGLYFIPFTDKRSVTEVGVRELTLEKIED